MRAPDHRTLKVWRATATVLDGQGAVAIPVHLFDHLAEFGIQFRRADDAVAVGVQTLKGVNHASAGKVAVDGVELFDAKRAVAASIRARDLSRAEAVDLFLGDRAVAVGVNLGEDLHHHIATAVAPAMIAPLAALAVITTTIVAAMPAAEIRFLQRCGRFRSAGRRSVRHILGGCDCGARGNGHGGDEDKCFRRFHCFQTFCLVCPRGRCPMT